MEHSPMAFYFVAHAAWISLFWAVALIVVISNR
jgi:hypothetical protein